MHLLKKDMGSVPIFILLLVLTLALGFACQRNNPARKYEQRAEIMGTVFSVTIEGLGDHQKGAAAAFDEIRRIDRLLSTYKPDSEISKVNRLAAQEPVPVGPDFLSVLAASRIYYDLSGGAFDPTIMPLMQLWGEARRRDHLPTEDELRKAKSLVGLSKVTVDPSTHTIRFSQKGMALDFGGIAKGYAVDRAIDILKSFGITRAIVDAGGNFYALGTPVDKPQWEAGVRHPLRKDEVIARFPVTNEGVATSGSYERFFEIGGKKYSHIINPHAGWPVEGMLSATILADTAMASDALSTTVFVLGRQEGMRLIEQLPGVEGIIISHEPGAPQNFQISVSSGLKSKIELLLPTPGQG